VKEGTFRRGSSVGTLSQALSSLQLINEPVMVQRKKTLSGSRRKRQRKQEKANAAPQADVGRELEAPTVANRALGLMLILGVAVAQKTAVTWWDTSGCPEPGEAY